MSKPSPGKQSDQGADEKTPSSSEKSCVGRPQAEISDQASLFDDLSSEGGFVDPQNRLEFASRASFEQGADPLPCWCNAEIKRINAHNGNKGIRIDALYAYFTRDGQDKRIPLEDGAGCGF